MEDVQFQRNFRRYEIPEKYPDLAAARGETCLREDFSPIAQNFTDEIANSMMKYHRTDPGSTVV